MQGYLSLVLHAHLPYVRHPEHETFLEESWLYEAITESYIPLLQIMERWLKDGMETRLTLSLSPTLCTMLLDPLLQDRYLRYLNGVIDLAEKEVHRTHWDKELNPLAEFYLTRLREIRETYLAHDGNLVQAFRSYQELDRIEIITTAATHALLPLVQHAPSIRAQILTARDHYRSCFGANPRGIWLPECAYTEQVEKTLQEANIRWCLVDTHGLLRASPQPRYGVFAPIFTPNGIAVFGRDLDSARQVWSRDEGYPGDGRYRDFYRDIGFDLDLDYLKPHLPAPPHRSFTGMKYYAITGSAPTKQVYHRRRALDIAAEHAQHFLDARIEQVTKLGEIMDRPPLLVSPYDAELFGHWWYEGPEFLDFLFRKAIYDQDAVVLTTPSEFLRQYPSQQVATPSPSSWGEEGYWRVWLNENNEWIYRHLQIAQERMTELAQRPAHGMAERALKQAARELLLAQASDWPFILRTGTSPDYARKRINNHLLRFLKLYEQITSRQFDEAWLADLEWRDNVFPAVNYQYWAPCSK
jgi:1,4-alpha-glucan branching enzyme